MEARENCGRDFSHLHTRAERIELMIADDSRMARRSSTRVKGGNHEAPATISPEA
jgi:hypothetical protein